MMNDGLKLIVQGSFGNIIFNSEIYNAKRIYLHHPSEHTVKKINFLLILIFYLF